MPTREALIKEALSWVGRPYKPSGAQENGANCLGCMVGILRNLGGLEDLVAEATPHVNYRRPVKSGELMRLLIASKHLVLIRPAKLEVGNLLLLRIQGEPQHLALLVEPRIVIHADAQRGRVIHHGLPDDWVIAAEFRIKGIEL